jgi:uroporphyrinogen-III synthase
LPPGLKAFCVGKKTLRTAEDMLEVEPILAVKNSETLVANLKESVPLGITFLYSCGSYRLNTLPQGLREAGFVVKEYVVYKTELTPHKTFRDYNVILFFSPSAVESYFSVNHWDRKTVAVSIGHSTSEALTKAGVETILIADEPNELSMLVKLHDYVKNGFIII